MSIYFEMETFGGLIRKHREQNKLTLNIAASYLGIDKAILSKIERGLRKAKREQIPVFAKYFNINENELAIAWLSDKLANDIGSSNEIAHEAFVAAETKVAYRTFSKTDRGKILATITKIIKNFTGINKAWIYGSFARGTDNPKSDIDIAVEATKSFSYFDLAELQFELEREFNRKVDIGFIDSFKPFVLENVSDDLTLIYEKR